MNLFLAQKTTPLKSKLAKLFAIFLVCFFVGGLVKTAHASPIIIYWKANVNGTNQNGTTYQKGTVYQEVITPGTSAGIGVYTPASYKYFIIDSNGGQTEINRPVGSSADWSPMPPTSNRTGLPLDPIAVNNGALGTLRYSYDGGYYYDTKRPGVILDPHKDKTELLQMGEKNAPQIQKNPDGSIIPPKTYNQTQVEATKNAQATGNPNTAPKPDMKCDFMNLGCMLAKALYYMVLTPSGWILGASGYFLDKVFFYTIVNLKGTLTLFGDVIKLVWGIFRDLINMALVFVLLYASVLTILKADTARLKTAIKNIIITALLINFSLFFVEIIIDVSNNFAVTIYNTINQGNSAGNNNLAVAYMDKLGLHTLWTAASANATKGAENFSAMIAICIFGSIFVLVLAVIFFVMAILFVLRLVEFIILMMMSPLGIGSIAIPRLNDAFPNGGYWSNLLNQAFFAPIMMIFLWISIKILYAITTPGGIMGSSNNLASIISNPTSATGAGTAATIGGYILGFSVMIAILIKGMIFAKTMSAKGASGAQAGFLKYSGADWIQKRMQNAPRGVGAFAGRNTAGRIATRSLDSEGFRNFASKNAFGRALYKGAQKTADGKFGGKTGFAKNEEARTKAREAFAKDLSKSTLSESLAGEDLTKTNKIIASRHIGDSEEKKKTLEKEMELNNNQKEAIHAEYEASKKELEEKRKVSSLGSLYSNPELEEKISSLEKNIKEKDEKGSSIKSNMDEIDAKLGEKLKDLKVGYEKNKHDESVKELQKQAEKIRNEDKAFEDKELKDLEDISKTLKASVDAGNERRKKYEQSLSSPRIFNLGIPSKASQQAAFNIRKEMNKSPDEKNNDKLLKQIREMAKPEENNKLKDKSEEKPKEEPKN